MVAETRSPLKGKPLRLPGQSVQEERDRLINDVASEWILFSAFAIAFALFEWYRWVMNVPPSPWLLTGVAAIVVGIAVFKVRRLLPRLRALRQAAEGERAVGQYLEGLREQGYRVFHDLVGDDFNVDHVLVGPTGVYTVETKTWSKPKSGKSELVLDQEGIKVLGREPDRDPVVQALAQAQWVQRLLLESTGKKVFVRPVVAFPGWFVTRTTGANRDVWVLEPKALPAFLEKEQARLADEDVKLCAYHLSRAIRAREALTEKR